MLPGLTFPVTAGFNFDPGFCLLYFAIPLFDIPAPAPVGLRSPLLTDIPRMESLLVLRTFDVMLLIESEDHQ